MTRTSLMGSWMRVEGLSLSNLPKRGINHVPVKKQSRRGQKRDELSKRRKGKKKVEMRVVRACKIHRDRVAKRNTKQRLLGEEATPSSTIHRYRIYICTHKTQDTYIHTYVSYVHVHTHVCMCIARAREVPSLFLGTAQRTSSRSLSPSLAVICPTWFGIVMQIQLRRFEPRGISLIRHAPRSHVYTCARRTFHSLYPVFLSRCRLN